VCSSALVTDHFGNVIGTGVRTCCIDIPVLLPDGSVDYEPACWTEVCGGGYAGLWWV
jgi:hypothetical protein